MVRHVSSSTLESLLTLNLNGSLGCISSLFTTVTLGCHGRALFDISTCKYSAKALVSIIIWQVLSYAGMDAVRPKIPHWSISLPSPCKYGLVNGLTWLMASRKMSSCSSCKSSQSIIFYRFIICLSAGLFLWGSFGQWRS